MAKGPPLYSEEATVCSSCLGPKSRTSYYCWGCWSRFRQGSPDAWRKATTIEPSYDVAAHQLACFHEWGPRPAEPGHVLPGQVWLYQDGSYGKRIVRIVEKVEPPTARVRIVWADKYDSGIVSVVPLVWLFPGGGLTAGTYTFLRHAYDAETFDPHAFDGEDYQHAKGLIRSGPSEAAAAAVMAPSIAPANPYEVDPDMARHGDLLVAGILGSRGGLLPERRGRGSYYPEG